MVSVFGGKLWSRGLKGSEAKWILHELDCADLSFCMLRGVFTRVMVKSVVS